VNDEPGARDNDDDNAGDYNAFDKFCNDCTGNSGARDNDDKDDCDASEVGARQMP
jgi:hypothetical protein